MFIEANDFSKEKIELNCYQYPRYLERESEFHSGKALYYVYENDQNIFVLPLIEREFITNNRTVRDLINPYGYPGYRTKKRDIDFVEEAFNEFQNEAYTEGYVSSFLRLNPSDNNLLFKQSEYFKQDFCGDLVVVDLNLPYEILKKNYSSNHRRNIKKLAKADFLIEINGENALFDFKTVYDQTMLRLNAQQYYFFDLDYYTDLKETYGQDMYIFLVKDENNKTAAGGLFIKSNNVLYYHLGGTSDEFLRQAPMKVVFDSVIKNFAESPLKLNLGGGLGSENDSLFNFKYGFSKTTIKYTVLKIIHNSDIYNMLTSSLTKEQREENPGFFPQYRKI